MRKAKARYVLFALPFFLVVIASNMSIKAWIERKVSSLLIPQVSSNRKTYPVDPDTNEPSTKVNHAPWNECLKQYISRGELEGIQLNVLDYDGLSADPKFEEYRSSLAKVDLDSLEPNEKLALYINAYNCLCVGLIIDHFKETGAWVASINDLSVKKTAVWDKLAGNVGGEDVSLNHIEHKVLRAKWAEPRVHASIVCASVSCPDLRNEAFEPHKINAQMSDQFTEWMKNDKKGLVVLGERKVRISKIFLWFAKDFTVKSTIDLRDYVNQYLSGDAKKAMSKQQKTKLEYFDYNWNLNKKV